MLLVLLFGLLVCVRAFEDKLFYDPYLLFFKGDYLIMDHPQREVLKLTLFTLLRYTLNTSFSLGIIFLVFRDRGILKFSLLIYTLALLVLLPIFLYFVIYPKQEYYYLFFNIRRFLIQPIPLLLLLPAFYYFKLSSKKS